MTDQNKISRRAWFRLAKPPAAIPANSSPSRPSVGNQPVGLEPIAHPVNYDGMDMAELPPMREATLSTSEVQQLFDDINALASDILLMQRSPRANRATAGTATTEQLNAARDALLSNTISRVQIRYHWQDTHWIDTLENQGKQFRLVRIAHETKGSANK